MVFLIQKAQNKDSLAIQLKLNELVAAHEFASNRLVNVENMSEEDLKVIQKYYARLSKNYKRGGKPTFLIIIPPSYIMPVQRKMHLILQCMQQQDLLLI